MIETDLQRKRFVYPLALLVLAVSVRLLSLQMIHTGFDERDYWFAAKRIVLGMPYTPIQHRTVRFGIILPVALVESLLGTDPIVYYAAPALLSVVSVLMAYRLAANIAGRGAGMASGLFLLFFPYLLRGSGSQIRPEIFSLFYVLGTLLFLRRAFSDSRGGNWNIAAAIAFFFLAYESKITNLFFYPGIFAGFLVGKRRWKELILFSASLMGLFLLETLTYRLVLGVPFGQLSIIAANHLSLENHSLRPMSFWGLFDRYSFSSLRWYWQAAFLLYLPAAAYLLKRYRSNASVVAIVLSAASFFLGITFAVKSINPIIPAEPFNSRYFFAVMGPLSVAVGTAAYHLGRIPIRNAFRKMEKADVRPRYAVTGAAFLAAILAAVTVASVPKIGKKFGEFFVLPWNAGRSAPARVLRYTELIREAWAGDMAIVSSDGVAGHHAIATATHFFLKDGDIETKPPSPVSVPGSEGKLIYIRRTLSRPPTRGERCLVALRFPFRVAEASLEEARGMLTGHEEDASEVE